jgi:argininosuccinate lyase
LTHVLPVVRGEQEDKEGMFDSFDTIVNMILITEGVVSTLTVSHDRKWDLSVHH